ncbi:MULTISPECIES: hypothetical protein [Sphingomonas]|jgi:hypothetical protein|nr:MULTISPECIES: hypothetical protein [Sphingomonas]WCP70994.1 hypothetical protein PPZ50_11515 [Sphingomonas hankookensis]
MDAATSQADRKRPTQWIPADAGMTMAGWLAGEPERKTGAGFPTPALQTG